MTEAEQERAAVVAWLRAKSGKAAAKGLRETCSIRAAVGLSFTQCLERAADAIERGDHLGGDT